MAKTYNVNIQRSKEEILTLKQEAQDSDTPESQVVLETIDWLFDSNLPSPLEIEDDEGEDFDGTDEDEDDDDSDDDEFGEEEEETIEEGEAVSK